jgi:distribution and morphology protein 31
MQRRGYSRDQNTAQERTTTTKASDSRASRQTQPSQQEQATTEQPGTNDDVESIASSVSKYLHLPHRPTKEELLAAANGFSERLKVRFKWMSIRSMRPWNADEWGAFVSWFMLGHIVWVLVGTTTFFSLLIFSINTVFAQGKNGHPLLTTSGGKGTNSGTQKHSRNGLAII